MSGDNIRDLSCSACGAPLVGIEENAIVQCAHCGKRHSSIIPPPPPMASSCRFTAGDAVAVSWGDKWWPARVTSIVDSTHWLVQYDGWGPTFKEEVTSERIRPLSAEDEIKEIIPSSITIQVTEPFTPALKISSAVLVLLVGIGAAFALWPKSETDPPLDSPSSQTASIGNIDRLPPNTEPITETNKLSRGQSVFILFEKKWFRGEVIEPLKNNRIRVHYQGWDRAFDEIVSITRLRIEK